MKDKISLLAAPKALEVLQANGYTLEDASKRLEKHYNHYRAVNYNEDGSVKRFDKKTSEPYEWSFTSMTDPEKIANKVVELLNGDKYLERKQNIGRRLNELPEKRQDWALLQIESVLALAENLQDRGLEDELDVEELKLNKEEEAIRARQEAIQARRADKAKEKAEKAKAAKK